MPLDVSTGAKCMVKKQGSNRAHEVRERCVSCEGHGVSATGVVVNCVRRTKGPYPKIAIFFGYEAQCKQQG